MKSPNCLRWLLYGYIHHKNTHTEFLYGTQLFSQKHTHTHTHKKQQNQTHHSYPWPQALLGCSSLQTIRHKSRKLWGVCSITFSPFQGKSIRVQYFFFSSTLQYRKRYWWTAPKICVIYQKIIQRIYELFLCKIISLITDNKSRIFFLIISKELHSTGKCFLPPFSTSSYQFSFLSFFVYSYIPLHPLSKVRPFVSFLRDFYQQFVVSRYFIDAFVLIGITQWCFKVRLYNCFTISVSELKEDII